MLSSSLRVSLDSNCSVTTVLWWVTKKLWLWSLFGSEFIVKVRTALLPAPYILSHKLEVSHGAWPAPQSLNLWNISSTLRKLHRDRTVEWSPEGAAHRGPRWDTTLFILQNVTDALSHWALRWVICSPVGQNTPSGISRGKGNGSSLCYTHTHTDILLPVPRFWSLLFGALGFQGRFVSTREDNSGPEKTEIETIWSFYH